MSRLARSLTVTPEGGFFHVFNRAAGSPRYFPFKSPRVRRKFLRWLRYCLCASCIRCVGFTLMGNHYHLLLEVRTFRPLARHELKELARARWGRLAKLRTRFWSDDRWVRFNHDLFKLDVFMRDFQGPFTTWFNSIFDRRGSLWAGRFKCVHLTDLEAVRECLFYIELNPVRARLTFRPETWKEGSASLRFLGRDEMLTPLGELFPDTTQSRVLAHYRARLLYRGTTSAEESRADIPPEILELEAARGFTQPGLYLKRLRFLNDGLVLGSADRVRESLERFRRKRVYRRRKHPISQLDGLFFTLREQRSHARI